MPMDYDDNDFEDQNHHLTGEGSSKFSPVLKPYALPKFDFSDSLHGQLRFDSLVENEVFLGIPSQEENHWIEDFSQGGGAIEFGSSAAESCTIVRHTNVWSEATSSESVEMLLKSVGQEEMVPVETIAEESEAGNVFENLTEPMDCYPSQVGGEEDDANPRTAVLSDNVLGNLSEMTDPEGIQKVQETEISLIEDSCCLDQNAVGERHGMDVAEKNVSDETKCDNTANTTELSAEGLLHSVTEKHPSDSMEIEGILINSSMLSDEKKTLSSDVVLNHHESHLLKGGNYPSSDIGDEVTHCLPLDKEDDKDDMPRENTFGKAKCSLDDITHHPSESDSGVHRTNSGSEEPTCIPLEGNQKLQKALNIGENACSKDSDPSCDKKFEEILSIETKIQHKANMDNHLTACSSDNQDSHNHADFGNSVAGKCVASETKMEPRKYFLDYSADEKHILQGKDEQLDSNASLLLSVESSTAPEFPGGKQVHGSGERVINICGNDEKCLNAKDSVSPYTHDENMQIAKGSNSSGKEEADAFPNEKKIISSPGEYTNAEADNIGSCRGVYAPDGKALESESNIASEVSGVVEVPSEEQTPLLHVEPLKIDATEKPDAEDLQESNGSPRACPGELNNASKAIDVVQVASEVLQPLLHVIPLNIDATEKTDAESLNESKGSPMTSPVEVDRIYNVLELDETQSYGSHGELKQETVSQNLAIEKTYNSVLDVKQQNVDDIVDQSLPVTDVSNTDNVNKQIIGAKTGCLISSGKLEVCLPCDPEVIEGSVGSVAELPVSPENNQVESAVCADIGGDSSGKHDSGMLTVVNNPDHSQIDRGEKGIVQEPNDNISLLPDAVKVVSMFQQQSDAVTSNADPNIMGLLSSSECFLKGKNNKKTLPSSVKKRASKKSMGAAVSPSTPVSSGISTGQDVDTLCGPKDITERKTRRGSGKASGQDDARKGSVENETPSAKQSERRSESLNAPSRISGSSELVHFDRMKSYVQVEHGGGSCITPVSTSKLPDLNTAVPPSSSFQQPFTVLQQVQLRAQIFVYGSLIQGVIPDEAYMVSAFASDDGGRLIWEPLWRASLERLQGKKIHIIKSETPVQLHSVGARPLEQQMKQSTPQVTVLPSPVGRTGFRDAPSVGNSNIPLSSPLWNISTPFESLHSSGMPRSPFPDYHQSMNLHPYQSPSSRSFGPSTSRLSQKLFTAPVTLPPSSTLDANARLPVRPMTETVKLTPIKESSLPVTSGLKMGSSRISPSISVPELKKDIASSTQSSGEVKSKKRKKAPISEDVAPSFLPTQTNTVALSTSLVISTPNLVSKGNMDDIAMPLLPEPFTDPKSGWKRPHQAISIAEDTSAKVEDSRQNAENAAALAATAVNQSLSAWNQLAKQKSSNMISEVEAKLVSAVVSINAAASVARAAAAAAQIASNAALQAKLMADEALSSIGSRYSDQVNAAFLSDTVNNLGELNAAAILNGGTDGDSSSLSIIVAAKEVARRKIETASSASRHAENLEVILKAAELAADAVAQAGKIILMGDPLPLSEVLEAGPSGYGRIPQQPAKQVSLVSDIYREPSRAVPPKDYPGTSGTHFVDGQIANEKQSVHASIPSSDEICLESMENQVVTMEGNSAVSKSFKIDATDNKPHRDYNCTKDVLPEPGMRSMLLSCPTEDLIGEESANQLENGIKEGCLVEVCKENINGKMSWFPATVLTLNDEKALVHYIELMSDEGSGPLKEWIALNSEGCMAPKIRTPHPITVPPHEGARKRRREAMMDYAFSSGDRVDVWVHNCWQEGIITGKDQNDETTLTISFPGEENPMVVRPWDLRPTLVWIDNQWIEWSCTRERNWLSQGDTPQGKRLRIGDLMTVSKEKDKRPEGNEILEPQFMPLSSSEQVFNVGKYVEDKNKVNKLRSAWTGMQTEGSGVIIGVPKPGKKRKFMDVSKHYGDTKIVKESFNDSTKNAKRHTSTQSIGGSRGWNNNTKIDQKEKKGAAAESSKAKASSRSGKPPSIPSRTLPAKKKDNDVLASSAVLTTTKEEESNNTGNDSNGSEGAQNPSETISSTAALVPRNKSKVAAPHGGRRMGGERVEMNESDDEYGKSNPEVAEPRRSNRRIQPTSRLLEGLQSSLVASKYPPVSHDKSHRSHHRGGGSTSRRNGHG